MEPTTSGDRGVSDVVGTVLLVGLVLTAALATIVIGTQAVTEATGRQEAAATTETLREVDNRMTVLIRADANETTSFDFGREGIGDLDLERRGNITVRLNGRSSCSGTIPLSSLRFRQGSQVVAYEAGGVFRGTDDAGSAVVSPPDFAYRNGTLSISVVNMTGTVDRSINEVDYLRNASVERSTEVTNNVITTPCLRPKNITVDVQSDFYGAWAEYFRDDVGVGAVSEFDSNDTARLRIDSSQFPARLDLERNRVVSLETSPFASYMTGDVGGGDPVAIGSNSVTFEKDTDSNPPETFPASVRPLERARVPNVTYLINDSDTRIVGSTRDPIDVVFVIDESGSMSGSKIDGARNAAKDAVGIMNTSDDPNGIGDRAGVIGYTAYPDTRFPDGRYLSSDSFELNSTIDTLSAGGNTDLAGALNESIAVLDTTRRNQSDGYIFLLTDGENSPGGERCSQFTYSGGCDDHFDERTRNAARIAAKRGYTVYTFGYGGGADDALLQDVADITGGKYNESGDASALSAVFQDTIEDITQEQQQFVARQPISTEVASGGTVRPPQVPGASDGIVENVTTGGNTYVNINDPAAPSSFSHSFIIDDGEDVVFDARTFQCNQEDGYEATGEVRTINGTDYPVARCTNITSTGNTLGPSNVTVYTNGSDAETASGTSLLQNDQINDTLEQYVLGSNEFGLESNEAIVRFDFRPEDDIENDLFVLYSAGRPESSVRSDLLLDVAVRIVEF
jgi:Mg-chelatase subunit ChlD